MLFLYSASLILALLLDKIFGEAPRYHPLVGFGHLAINLEKISNQADRQSKLTNRVSGLFSVMLLIAPFVTLTFYLESLLYDDPLALAVFSGFVLYTCIGWNSLKQHIQPIYTALKENNIKDARAAVALIVSRDTQNLSEQEISSAAAESALENGADAIFSAIFWFLIAGAPGVVLYRLSNTLDAMWGYKNERFLTFGWAAARLDDILNFVPARLTAFSYALLGHTKKAIRAWRIQGRQWKSPNAGPVMAAGAGALNIKLGGAASYHGYIESRPRLGLDSSPNASPADLNRALRLIDKTLLLWCVIVLSVEAIRAAQDIGLIGLIQ